MMLTRQEYPETRFWPYVSCFRSAKTYSQGDREVNIFTSFACPFGYCDIERPRLSELLHTAQKDGTIRRLSG